MWPPLTRSGVPFGLLVAAMLALGAGAGCGQRDTPREDENAMVIAIQSDGDTLDPHQAQTAASQRLVENMYSTLMRLSDEYPEIEPDLLADYEVDEAFQVFDLTLEQDVRFHSGNPLTARDVAFSLERIRDMGTSQPMTHLREVVVHDDHHLTLHFDEPMSPLMTYLALPTHAIVDRQVVEEHDGDIDRVDAGSGPFQLVEWRPGRRLELERFEDYHEPELPRLDRLTYRPIPDDTARVVALGNREVDVVVDVPVASVDNLERQEGVTLETVPGTFWEYVGFNTRQPPFDDARVRQAVAHAIDREAINQGVKYGRARVLAGGPIPPHHWADAHLELYPEPELGRARHLLADAGHREGLSTQIIVGTDFPYQVDAAQMIAEMLRRVGIDARVNQLETGQFFNRLNEGDFEMTVVGWVGFVDPDQWFADIYHSEGMYNQQGYASDEVDALIAAGRAAGPRHERRRIYAELQEQIADDAPTVFLYMNDQIGAHLDDVRGFVVHPTATTISAREAHWR